MPAAKPGFAQRKLGRWTVGRAVERGLPGAAVAATVRRSARSEYAAASSPPVGPALCPEARGFPSAARPDAPTDRPWWSIPAAGTGWEPPKAGVPRPEPRWRG